MTTTRRSYHYKSINIDEWLLRLPNNNKQQQFDVRSEDEYCSGNILGSINIPVLNNNEFNNIGILYKNNQLNAKIVAIPLILKVK